MAIFGTQTSRPVHWLQTGLREARRVGRIHNRDGQALATGFLLEGGLVNQELRSLPLFLTCNHCVASSTSRHEFAVPWSEAAIVFQQQQTDPSVKGEAAFLQSLSESPAYQLNYTLLLLDRWPGTVGDLKIAPRRPVPKAKVFVISYPGGRGLSISLDDNDVVDVPEAAAPPPLAASPGMFHYRAPTEGGSSGAPVFNEHWEIVAIHIGSDPSGSNYGVPIDSVLAHARSNLAGLSIPRVVRESITQKDKVSPAILQEAVSYFSVFISYSREDASFARRLYHALEANGVRAWLDETHIVPGQFIDEAVQKGIAAADRFVLCCSKASLENSWWVDSEVTSIFEKERELSKASGRKLSVVIPVKLDDHLTNGWKGAKAPELRSRLATDFTEWEDDTRFAAGFERLLLALRTQDR
jgi:hypothetical protein